MASNNKYDRQLRLWGAAGQESLALSHAVLVSTAGAVGTELLKNLVLPGLGGFTVVDAGMYPTSSETGQQSNTTMVIPQSNFFYPPPSASTDEKSVAEVISTTMNELNPEVNGGFVKPSCGLSEFISNAVSGASTPETSLTEFIKQSTSVPYPPSRTPAATGAKGTVLLIGNDLSPRDCVALSKVAKALALPLVLVRTYGFIGTCRVQSATGEFQIMEPRPETVRWDLRMNETVLKGAFPALQSYVDSKVPKLAEMDVQQHSHVPYVVLLCKAVKDWMGKHGKMPGSFEEKDAFKAMIKAESKNFGDELNYQEAVREAYTAYCPSVGVPEEVKELFARDDVKSLTAESSQFCILLNSLSSYLMSHADMPPLNGSIPDMTSDTDSYVALQTIYVEQSKKDLADFTAIVKENLAKLGLEESYVPPATISTFAKNVPYLAVVPSKSYHDEVVGDLSEEDKEGLMMQVWDPYESFSHSPFLWWIGMKSAEKFHLSTGSWPGVNYEDEAKKKEDVDKLSALMLEFFQAYGVDVADMDEGEGVSKPVVRAIAEELCRFNGAEMHNIGSVLGGVAGQEAVKIITGQYTPIKNTYLFNGISGVAGVMMG